MRPNVAAFFYHRTPQTQPSARRSCSAWQHAADVPSLLFLQLFARNARAGGCLGVVGTYRDAEAPAAL
jgi:hypothetical protein